MVAPLLTTATITSAAAPPPASDTQCDWFDDMTGTPTTVDFDVVQFAGIDVAPTVTVDNFTWAVNLDNTGDPFHPDPQQRTGIHAMASNSPTVAAGTMETGLGTDSVDLAAGCRYLISVRADGYKIGGAHIRIEADGTIIPGPGVDVDAGAIQVVMISDQIGYDEFNQPTASCGGAGEPECGLPLADLVVNVFHDANLVDAQFNTGEEGLAGFNVLLEDGSGEVTVDFFGNELCGGDCVTDADGVVVIEDIPAGFYDINIIEPAGSDWVQTTTIEGTHNIEAWALENFDNASFDSNFLVDPAQRTFFNFGFSSPTIGPDLGMPGLADDPPYPYVQDPTGGDISGAIYNKVLWPPNEVEVLENGDNINGPPPGVPGGIVEPVRNAWVALNDVTNGDRQIALTQADNNGNFTFPDVPAGTYQLVYWDNDLFYIIGFSNVVVPPNTDVTGLELGAFRWFGWINGYVFYDNGIAKNGQTIAGNAADGTARAGNGIRDCIGDQQPGFVYWGSAGLVDPSLCETGLPNTEVILRDRDGSVSAAGVTDANGRYEFPDILGPVFEAQVLEVSAGTLDFTGHSTHDEFNMNLRYTQGFCEPGPNQNLDFCQPADAGGGLLLAQITMAAHRSEVDFGKLAYSDPAAPNGIANGGAGNGGIAGGVIYGTTRNEYPAKLQAFEDYEPGIPEVDVAVYAYDPACGDPTYGPDMADPSDDGNCLTDLNGTPNTAIDAVQTDHFEQPTDCDIRDFTGAETPDTSGFAVDANCVEVQQLSNETKDGAWDGGFAFGDLPPGEYIVEVTAPDYLQVLKENDLNTAEGLNLVPDFPPGECVGEFHYAQLADDYGSPFDAFDDGDAFIAGSDAVRLCNRRAITVAPNLNAAVDIFLLPTDEPYVPNYDPAVHGVDPNNPDVTPVIPDSSWTSDEAVPIPGRIFGLVLNDLIVETDPNNIRYGDNAGAANVPVGVYDFTGRLVTTVWTDDHGWFEVLLPSTAVADAPIPGGVSPHIYELVANDPGRDAEPNFGYNPQAISEPFPKDVWPGKMTKADMPIIPRAIAECNLLEDTPHLMTISDVVAPTTGGAIDLTLTGTGFDDASGTAPTVTATDSAGAVTTLSIVSFTPSAVEDMVVATLPAGLAAGMYQIDVSRSANDSPRNGVSFHLRGPGYNPPVVTVEPPAVLGTPAIQSAIDAAAPGSLIVVEPGIYQESIIVHKEVKLQGYGPGGEVGAPSNRIWDAIDGTVVTPRFGPTDVPAQAAWAATLAGIGAYGPNQNVSGGAAFSILLDSGEANGADGFALQIDGFGVTAGRGESGGGIWANGNATDSIFSNNVLQYNSASRGGGGITLGVHSAVHSEAADDVNNNSGITIRDNRILGNGGVFSAGGLGIFNDADGYVVEGNDICGNYSAEYGGGVSHFGNSPGGAIVDNAIYYNGAFDEGGGILVGGESGGMAFPVGQGSGDVVVEGNIIQSNLSNDDGGGIMLLNPLNDRVDIVNNMIVNNAAADYGGGIALDNADDVTIVNNTIAENLTTSTAEDADFTGCGGVQSCPRAAGLTSAPYDTLNWTPNSGDTFSDPVMFNNIFWQNRTYVWNTVIPPGEETNLEFFDFIDMEIVDTIAPTDVGDTLSPSNSMLTVPYPGGAANIVGVDPLFEATDSTPPRAIAATQGGQDFITVLLHTPEDAIIGTTDYGITPLSDAIDAGAASFGGVAAPGDDYEDDPRPLGITHDIGADELDAIFFSTVNNHGAFRDEDILTWDGEKIAVAFDLSSLGVTADVKAMDVIDADTFLVSFQNDGVVLPDGGGTADDEDVAMWDDGEWSVVFNGSDFDLADGNPTNQQVEDIDALYLKDDGSLIVSTVGNARYFVNGNQRIRRDEDLLRFIPTEGSILGGDLTEGRWTNWYFDGSDVGLAITPAAAAKDVYGADERAGDLYLTFQGDTDTPFTGPIQDEDIGTCLSVTTGAATACAGGGIVLDGSAIGLAASNDIDGVSIR